MVTGPESTGKSTLSLQLAQHFKTCVADEYAREYIGNLPRAYNQNDLLVIAKGQIENEKNAIKNAKNSLVICDTDLHVIRVWSENAYHACGLWILQQIAERHYDFYILCDIDMPWQPDTQREHPEPEMRRYFFNIYKDVVVQSGVPFVIVSGDENERLSKAIAALKDF